MIPPEPTIPAPVPPKGATEIPVPPEVAAMMEFMMPGPKHAWLSEKSGAWTFTGRMWMSPGAPADIGGTATFEMDLGGRFLVEQMRSTAMGQQMDARGTTGFNRGNKQFQLTWMDSMGTQIIYGTGARSADGKTLESSFEMFDPMAGRTIKVRSVETRVDLDHFTFEMFGPGADGKEAKSMELSYTRATK